MPRKAHKTQKPPLQFVEPPRGGARNRTNVVPEVRAALNPKSFITEGHSQDGSNSTLTTWVSPQFDTVNLAAPPARRGQRQCHSVTGITDKSTQLTRRKKKSVCQRYPSLSFKRTQDQPHQSDQACGTKATEPPVVSIPEHQQQQQGLTRQVGSPASSCRGAQQHVETPKRCSTLRRRNAGLYYDGPSCSSRRLEHRDGAPSVHLTGKRRIPAFRAPTTPPATATESSCTPDVSGVPPPDVDTPEVLHEEEEGGGSGSSPSSAFLDILFSSSELSASACDHRPCDILVTDTPERDYGLKVTWRRRREMMKALKQRGSLSDADVLIDC